ncbi:MAG TPA: DNA-3-methyladenine glycosylase [Candidatus Nanoarchaeia archaeon]|nr:DNA-3-methyladenine glycosylase [Candidatus Nanoarchaeia archaeon]
MILPREFYKRDALTVAKALLGKIVVHETAEGRSAGRIVETEAYVGPEDKASHAYQGLRTKRTETQFGEKGHAYIYLIYGLYYCFNVVVGEVSGKPEAVLMRALEPVEGIQLMSKRRSAAGGNVVKLANGPGKLCAALGISNRQNGLDVCVPPFFIQDGPVVSDEEIETATRIGVDYADEWKNKPWRFYIRNCSFVSVRNK